MGIVERGLDDLRTGEVRFRGEVLPFNPRGDDFLEAPESDAEAALRRPPAVPAVAATGIAVRPGLRLTGAKASLAFPWPRNTRPGLSIMLRTNPFEGFQVLFLLNPRIIYTPFIIDSL